MATAGNDGAGEISHSVGMSSNGGGNVAATGVSELEQLLKQVIVTRYEIKHPTTMEDLPDELLTNIFARLLARQLAQMRTVSKTWNVLLSHPYFVKSHLHRSIHTNNQQILLVFHFFHDSFTEYSCQSPHLEPINFIKHIPTNLQMSWVLGSVNGLICLSNKSHSHIDIWNPSLSVVSTIPPPHSLPPESHCDTNMRFGFDPKNDDYKLVKILGIRNNNNYFSVKRWLEVEVYSVRKGCWEFITQPFPSHITYIFNDDHLCVDGHHGYLHWEVMSGSWTSITILAFDLGSQTFREIPLPDSILHSNHEKHHLGVLGGKLCEISRRVDGEWEVWVMEEYGLSESWAKHHVLSQFIGDWRFPHGFTSRNEFLLEDEDEHLVLYDPIANKTKSSRTKQRTFSIVEFVDSLVWI